VNLISGRRYRGASPVLLTLGMHLRGSALPFWCGFGEGKTCGLSPRKGSKAVYVLQPQVHVSPAEDATAPAPDGSAPEGVMYSWVTYRPIPVFNAADLVGEALPTLIQTRREAQGVAQQSEPERLATAEAMLSSWPGWRWSMAGARLARDLSGVMGSRAYAREELVAELGAVLLGERLEIGSNVANHAAYLASWIALLRDHHGCWWRSLEMRAGPWI
jgi:antirestriction protein ArdC